ncbi:MAG: thymidylate synthase [Desulfobacterales bacterium]|jgi:thymidylate synthase|nr:thymidylate synthase [Desulfobacterales bacterium]
MDMNPIFIQATTIDDAWFQCVSAELDHGRRYEIQHGSYVGQTRLEFDYITVLIRIPYAEPWDMMLPKIPAHLGIPDPVAPGYVEQYAPYLLASNLAADEQYTYGSRISPQIKYFISLLKSTPNTNQAIFQVAEPGDCRLSDPPCLRHIDMRVQNGSLIFFPYFRSWDLWSGFPANLAGIAVLQKMLADEIGVGIGPIVAASKGLHLYGYVENLAKLRCAR